MITRDERAAALARLEQRAISRTLLLHAEEALENVRLHGAGDAPWWSKSGGCVDWNRVEREEVYFRQQRPMTEV